jgi:AcrR family transcriptional regulator
MLTDPTNVSQLGRPRDARIDSAVLLAVLHLLLEVGYQKLTITEVASRAGTTKPAIYRRWQTKAQLVHEAVFPSGDEELVPDTGDLAADLHTMVSASVELFTRPEVRAAWPGLLAELSSEPELHDQLLERFSRPVWSRLQARIDRAVASGEARPDVDSRTLLDVIGGATLMAIAVRPERKPDDRWIDQTVALITRGVLT